MNLFGNKTLISLTIAYIIMLAYLFIERKGKQNFFFVYKNSHNLII